MIAEEKKKYKKKTDVDVNDYELTQYATIVLVSNGT